MPNHKLLTLDNLSLQDFDSEADLIPLLTPEDEEEMTKEELPASLPILPLRNTVLFPGVVIPITAGRDKSIKLIDLTELSDVVNRLNFQLRYLNQHR